MRHKKSDLPLYEQFTIQGFWAVSGWALACGIQVIPLSFAFKQYSWFPEWGFWKTCFYTYGVLWFICFLTMCLIPKLRGEK